MSNPEKTWATAADVARQAGVSRSAVSRAFTPGASISPDTKARVLRAAEALGYQVNILARSVIQRQSNLVGVVVAGFEDPFRLQLLGPITRHLAAHDLVPLLMDAANPEQLTQTLRGLLRYRIAGVIMTSGSPPEQLAQEYLQRHIPVAMLNRAPGLQGVDVVNSDNRCGGALAADALLASGARRLAFVNTAASTYSGIERGDAFSAVLAPQVAAGHCSVELLRVTQTGYLGGRAAAQALLGRPNPPDGVFCATDLLACGFIDGARHLLGLRVPENVRVIGFDDIPMASMDSYALTTIRQDTDRLAGDVVAHLVERMESFATPGRLSLSPVSLVVRQSAVPTGNGGGESAG